MAINLIHRIYIAAPPGRIYDAITTANGIKSWWTTDVAMGSRVGGSAVFGFEGRSVVFEMRIEELSRPSRIRWKCVSGTSPDWVGTTQEFQLEPRKDGEVLLKFCHGGWKPGSDYCHFCNTTWGHLLVALKNFVEKGRENPYFT